MAFLKQNGWLIGVVLLALVLRMPLLGGSFWLDEAAQVLESARPLNQQLQISHDFQPPLIHLLVHFSLRLGKSEWWLRTVAALIPGLITVGTTYLIGKKYFTKSTAIATSVLLATSSLHVFYSQELRPYALPAMWATLSWYVLLDKESRHRWLIWGLLNTLGLYSSYLYPFLFFSQLVFIWWDRRTQIWEYLRGILLSVVLFLPWLPSFLEQLSVGGSVRSQLPGWSEVVSLTQLKAVPLVLAKFIFGVVPINPDLYVLGGGCALGIVGLYSLSQYFIAPSKKRRKILRQAVPILIWLVIPLLAAWLVSFAVPVIRPKRMLLLLPAFYLGISQVSLIVPAKVRTTLIGLLLAINIFGLYRYYNDPMLQRENWRNLHFRIERQYQRGAVAVFSFPEPFAPWIWYNRDQFPSLATGNLHIDQVENLATTLKPVTEYNYVLVFDYLRDLTDPDHKIEAQLESFGYQEVGVIDEPLIGFVRVFARKEATISAR